MSDDDDKGKKTNADPVHKPEQAAQKDVAPRSAVGRKPAGLNLGGGSARRQVTQEVDQPDPEQPIVFRQNQAQDKADDNGLPALDPNKDIAIATGNPQYDQELAKDHNVITREQAEQLLGKETVAQRFYDEPGTAVGSGSTPENTSDADKQKAQELFDQMKKQRDRDKGHGR